MVVDECSDHGCSNRVLAVLVSRHFLETSARISVYIVIRIGTWLIMRTSGGAVVAALQLFIIVGSEAANI